MYNQYIPGKSLIHRLSSEVKLSVLLVFILAGFIVRDLPAAFVYFLSAVLMAAAAKLSFLIIFRKIKKILWLLIAGLIFNLIFSYWQTALTVFLRLTAIVLTAQIFIFTTSPEEVMFIFEDKLKLKREYLVSIMIAISFISILENVYREIRQTQIARGNDWTTGNLFRRIQKLLPVIIPIFRFSLKKAEIMGEALTIKGYSTDL